MRTFQTLAELAALVGQEVAVSDWITITQEQVNQFAQATGDHQWIHVDVERAKAGPFGGPIAHGFLTLSLIPKFFESSFEIVQSRMGVTRAQQGAFHGAGARGQSPARPDEAAAVRADRQRGFADGLGSGGAARRLGQAGVRGGVDCPALSLNANPFCRQASNTVTATALDRFRLR
jgi:hypothetical protein